MNPQHPGPPVESAGPGPNGRSATGTPSLPGRGEAGRVLVVDDEETIARALQRYLSRLGHHVEMAQSVAEAVTLLAPDRFDLVLTDLRLQGASGLDLLVEVAARSPGTRMILMSGNADVPAAARAIEQGVDQLLIKPFELDTVRAGVEESLARRREVQETERQREILEAKLRMRDTESKIWILRAAHAMAAAVEAKDAYTAGHAMRVTGYAISIAERVGGIDLLRFRLAGDLHDVGKIGVPDMVLNKPGRLTTEETELVKKHPEAGARILEPLIDDPMVLGVVRWHHERWDGMGYPDGLAGEAIPLPSRVLAVADTLDAMTSRRAYRDGLPWEVALAEIRRCAGTQFDPNVVEAFNAALPVLEAQYRKLSGSPPST
ncbi:MAG TPA: HD domain-containing phosphohydrolase [Longimicrobiaceae bacterium]|nr:HD domain-containing phosphohydrolase [Longimicrobiaceae bacterium]